MLTRLHVDNWRSFVNFEVKLGTGVVLLLGDNGSGKTGIFDVLRLHSKIGTDAWRVHFIANGATQRVLVRYIGRHLPTSRDPT